MWPEQNSVLFIAGVQFYYFYLFCAVFHNRFILLLLNLFVLCYSVHCTGGISGVHVVILSAAKALTHILLPTLAFFHFSLLSLQHYCRLSESQFKMCQPGECFQLLTFTIGKYPSSPQLSVYL